MIIWPFLSQKLYFIHQNKLKQVLRLLHKQLQLFLCLGYIKKQNVLLLLWLHLLMKILSSGIWEEMLLSFHLGISHCEKPNILYCTGIGTGKVHL